jgi:serine O-acetyltransferase
MTAGGESAGRRKTPRYRDLVFADLHRYRESRRASWRNVLITCLGHPGLIASVIMRAQLILDGHGYKRASSFMRTINVLTTGLDVLPGATIGPGLLMHHPNGIVIGSAAIGANVTLLQHTTLGERHADGRPPHEYPTLEDDVVISVGACVLGGVRVGRGAVIAAQAVVLEDVPAGCVAAGIPAVVVRKPS